MSKITQGRLPDSLLERWFAAGASRDGSPFRLECGGPRRHLARFPLKTSGKRARRLPEG